MYRMYSLHYIVPFISSDLCAAYYDYFPALTHNLRPCNINEIFVSCRFPLPAAPQELVVAILILRPLPSIHLPLSGQSGLFLQANTPPPLGHEYGSAGSRVTRIAPGCKHYEEIISDERLLTGEQGQACLYLTPLI